MRMSRWLTLVLLIAASATAAAEVPGRLGYQGRLLKSDGSPEAGSKSITFSLYDAATGGTNPLWTETQTLALSDGYYATFLGSVQSFGAGLFDGRTLYLELKVDGAALSPRQEVGTVPYALLAGGVSGGVVDAAEIKVGHTTVIDSTGKLAGSASYSAGSGLALTGTSFSLATNCAATQVLRFNGTSWVCSDSNTITAGSGLQMTGSSLGVMTCAANQVLKYGASGWVCGDPPGTVTQVSAAPGEPLSVATGTTTPTISIAKAGATSDGYLSSADWNTFNKKIGVDANNHLTIGDSSLINPNTADVGVGNLEYPYFYTLTLTGNGDNFFPVAMLASTGNGGGVPRASSSSRAPTATPLPIP